MEPAVAAEKIAGQQVFEKGIGWILKAVKRNVNATILLCVILNALSAGFSGANVGSCFDVQSDRKCRHWPGQLNRVDLSVETSAKSDLLRFSGIGGIRKSPVATELTPRSW